MRHGVPESRNLRSRHRNDKSARTPYILVSGPRGSKLNIGNVLAGYLTNCYKLWRAFSRPAESAASYIPPSTPPCSRTGVGFSFRQPNERYGGDHMVFPYVHATAMVLTLISTAVHSRGAARRRLEDEITREAEIGRRIWIDRQRAISFLSEKYDDPGRVTFAYGCADLVKSRRIGNYGKFVPVHWRWEFTAGVVRCIPTDETNERVNINSYHRIIILHILNETGLYFQKQQEIKSWYC